MRRILLNRAAIGLALMIVATVCLWPHLARAQSASAFEALHKRVIALYHAGKYAEAVPLAERFAEAVKARLGSESPEYAASLYTLALLHLAQGRHREAEGLFKRALAIAERALRRGPLDISGYLTGLAAMYVTQERYAEAEPLFERAIAIAQKAHHPDHQAVGVIVHDLAVLYLQQGRYTEAETLFKRVLEIDTKAVGPEDKEIGIDLTALADLYRVQGRDSEAEVFSKRAIAIFEKALRPDHPFVASPLKNLATLYITQDRYVEAEPLLKRALAISEAELGAGHLDVAAALNALAEMYHNQRRYAEAEPLFQRAIEIAESTLGPDSPTVGIFVNNLAVLYTSLDRHAEAEALHKRALAIAEKAFGPDHPSVGGSLLNLANVYRARERYDEAEPLMKRALAINEKVLGADHQDTAAANGNLAEMYFSRADWARAAEFWRRSTGGIMRRTQRGTHNVGHALTGKRKSEAEQRSSLFAALVKVVHRLAPERRNDVSVQRETFQTAQWSQSSEAAASLAQMAARGAKDDLKLAKLVRERQDLVAEWQNRDVTRSTAASQGPDKQNAHAANVLRLAEIDSRIGDIDRRLAAGFPDYAAFVNPAPMSIEDVRTQLRANEALVLFLDTPEWKSTPDETFIWVVTKMDSRWVRTGLGNAALTREVAALRCGLDRSNWIDATRWPEDGAAATQRRREQLARRARCKELLGREVTRNDLPPFDLARAYELYEALFDQIKDLIEDKHLLIVPSGPLTQLPFQILVTERPGTPLPSSLVDYRDAAWLVRRHAISVLPAVSSLKALREFAKRSHASELFVGFGNPLLDGEPAKYENDGAAAKLARAKRCTHAPSQRIASWSDPPRGVRAMETREGRLADSTDLRRQQPLPETADELCVVARNLDVDPAKHLYLGAAATEAKIKQLSRDGVLAKYKIVHFATHGALAGQISRMSESGLILTPPSTPSDTNDGYLSASEVAALKLDADWVILSACNTAAGETQGAEALSGLARAFFYAGARSLLVSHWAVASEAAVKLIAGLQIDPKMGRAEALQRSMLKLITSGRDFEAHPAIWAPFILVGEGSVEQ